MNIYKLFLLMQLTWKTRHLFYGLETCSRFMALMNKNDVWKWNKDVRWHLQGFGFRVNGIEANKVVKSRKNLLLFFGDHTTCREFSFRQFSSETDDFASILKWHHFNTDPADWNDVSGIKRSKGFSSLGICSSIFTDKFHIFLLLLHSCPCTGRIDFH